MSTFHHHPHLHQSPSLLQTSKQPQSPSSLTQLPVFMAGYDGYNAAKNEKRLQKYTYIFDFIKLFSGSARQCDSSGFVACCQLTLTQVTGNKKLVWGANLKFLSRRNPRMSPRDRYLSHFLNTGKLYLSPSGNYQSPRFCKIYRRMRVYVLL